VRIPVLLLGSLILFVGVSSGSEKPELTDEREKLSYSIGYQVGGDFKRQGLEINPEVLIKGIEDAMREQTPLMSTGEMRSTLVELQRRAAAAQEEKRDALGQKNLAEGETFLEENAAEEGVITRPSGLQYKVVRAGSGRTPAPGDSVTVHYRGTLIDGTEFDSSYSRGNPATFASNRVIQGWQEALSLMKEGDKWKVFVPAGLAYGERGAGAKIGPNSTLIFEVELISVNTAD